MIKLDNVKRYYAFTLPAICLAFLLLGFTTLSLEQVVPFLLVYSFAVFLEHPRISEYRENPRKRLAFVSVVFSAWNSLNMNLPEKLKYREKYLTHGVGVILSLILLIIDFNFSRVFGIVFGVLIFEIVFLFYIRLTPEDDL